MSANGFLLRKWRSNSDDLMKMIATEESPKSALSPSSSPNNCEDDSSYSSAQFETENSDRFQTVLGVGWDITDDVLLFNLSDITKRADTLKLTKRNILKISGSFYDPLGILSPLTIQAKVIFQSLCKEKVNWDDSVSESIVKAWKDFVCLLRSVDVVKIPRYIMGDVISYASIQLHGCCQWRF